MLVVPVPQFVGHMLSYWYLDTAEPPPQVVLGPLSFLLRPSPTWLRFPRCFSTVQFPNQDSYLPPTLIFYSKDMNLDLHRVLPFS